MREKGNKRMAFEHNRRGLVFRAMLGLNKNRKLMINGRLVR